MDGAELLRELGGPAGCRALSEAFYTRVKRDPVLRPFFPGASLRCAVEELTAFLVQLLDGPPEATQFRWWVSLRESHQRFRIGPEARDAWLRAMAKALTDVAIQSSARAVLCSLFENLSAHVVSGGAANPGRSRLSGGHPSEARTGTDLAQRQREVDAVVAEVRAGNMQQAIELAEDSAYIQRNRPRLAAMLGLMLAAGLAEYVRGKLERDPALTTVRYSGRTLLHAAAAAGDAVTVELLLRLGALPDAPDDGAHTALYSVANQCQSPGGPDVVRALIRAGADVNACGGSKLCTALHMAARRGNVDIATALLDCHARLDPRDSLGETPLRRAVNCNKSNVAALLVARGADPNSVGSKGLTPKSAARTAAMRRLLEAGD